LVTSERALEVVAGASWVGPAGATPIVGCDGGDMAAVSGLVVEVLVGLSRSEQAIIPSAAPSRINCKHALIERPGFVNFMVLPFDARPL
jgi:hypothetical protein